MDEKIRAYVCTGCGIGQCMDPQKLARVASEEHGLPVQVHPPLCVPEGVEFLRKDIQQEGAEKIVIAACSERVNWDVFSSDSLQVGMIERVNIREQVAWSKPPNDEETQSLAEDYLRMGIARAQKGKQPEPQTKATERTLLVVGGGITGMTAALEAAGAESDVVLVEKEATLGGWLARFHKMYPTRSPYRELEDPTVDAMIDEIRENPKVTIFTSSQIEKISGEPGSFDVTISQDGVSIPFRVGSAVVATGWEPYDPGGLEHLGFGKYCNVINNVAVEEIAKAGKIARPSDGKPVRSVAFIQRLGSRREDPFSYGSIVGDMVTLKQALYFRKQNPEATVYIFYEDMITPGQYEDFYRRVQEEKRVLFTKGDVKKITEDSDGSLVLDVENTLIGGGIRVTVDMVVLATGMVPTTVQSDILHLGYKQGPELPDLKYGFPNSNYICFPYETRRTGVYAAGCVRESMDVVSSVEDASGAALKAIQSLELISKGSAVHPRVGDLSLPITNLQGCTKCGRCSEECPFGAIEVDEGGFPQLSSNRCRRCGICMGACPTRVISFEDYNVEQLSSMIKAIEFPEDLEKFRILAFACENDAYPAFDMAGINRLAYDASVRVIPVRCLGSLNVVLVIDALSQGIDGVMLMGCKSGADYQCHFIRGSELSQKRAANIQERVGKLMLEEERVKSIEIEITEYDLIPNMVAEFVEVMKRIGPNPYKGFSTL